MKIFVPVAWPYANGELHLGTLAGSLLAPDIFARFHRQKGNDVLMVSGTDMHGTPVELAAEKLNKKPKVYSTQMHKEDLKDMARLGMSFNLYTSTDTDNHREIVQELFNVLLKKRYIIKKKVQQYWSEKEKKFLLDRYIEGECPHCHYTGARGDQCDKCGRTLEPTELINPRSKSGDTDLVLKDGEDYFLNLPKLQKDIEEWLDKHPNKKRWKEHVMSCAKAWLKEGLQPRAITRDLSYGIPLPKGVDIKGADKKVIYVWFEAVTGYWSAAVEWSKRVSGEIKGGESDIIFNKYKGQTKSWRDFWQNKSCKHYYFMGKDNIVFHTIIWPAMLIGWNKDKKAGDKMQLAYDVPANAFLNLEGDKMSKSRNWFVGFRYLLDTYGQDLVRYYFTLRMPENKDSDFRWKDFVEVNNNDLVANLGNFIHRTLSFIETKFDGVVPKGKLENEVRFMITDTLSETESLLEDVKFSESIQRISKLVSFANKYFDKKAVWKIVKKSKKDAGHILYNCIQLIESLRVLIAPFLPNASSKLTRMLGQEDIKWEVGKDNWKFEKYKEGKKLGKVEVLFKKIEPEVAEKERAKLKKS